MSKLALTVRASKKQHGIRAALVSIIFNHMDKEGLSQKDVANLLNVPPPEISRLKTGSLNRYSLERLMDFLNLLGFQVLISVSPSKSRKGARTIINSKNKGLVGEK